MSKSLNKVQIIGNAGADPDIRSTANGKTVTTLSIATSRSWTDRESGQKQESTEWHKVVFFERLAEIAGEYIGKGSKVYIEGALRTRKWQDQNGTDRYTTEIVGKELILLDSRGSGDYSREPAPRSEPARAVPDEGDKYIDDDIPF